MATLINIQLLNYIPAGQIWFVGVPFTHSPGHAQTTMLYVGGEILTNKLFIRKLRN